MFCFVTLLLGALSAGPAHASRADLGGYVRIGTRPDLQGGWGSLGYWNLYGRLLNEGPYAAVELKLDILEQQAAGTPWSSLHLKVEGGAVDGASPSGGSLSGFRLSQLYTRAGDVAGNGLVWRVGTLESTFGDLGLYDMRPAQVLWGTVGLQTTLERERLELALGVGDSGYTRRGDEYSTVLTAGGTVRLRMGGSGEGGGVLAEVGLGGEVRHEPSVEGNRYSPLSTPGVSMEDLLRGEVAQSYLQENPNQEREFPAPVGVTSSSGKAVGYLGFGRVGPLVWNNTFISYERLHPESYVVESYGGLDYTIYVTELTDQRTVLMVGDELQLRLIPRRLDLVWAGLLGNHQDADNALAPSDHARRYHSTVLRLQAYLTNTVHWLGESSIAREISSNGNAYREHADSIFTGKGGLPDSDGFEYGDTDTRVTFQGKTGFVLNPLGPGIYTRPSLRILYGVQVSNDNNAFGNSFVETIDQYNEFGNVEQHVHHVIALETEAWF